MVVDDALGVSCGGRLFDASGTVVPGNLPGFGPAALPFGEQRDAPFFPVMANAIVTNPSPPATPLDNFGVQIDENLSAPNRWDNLGFCGTAVP